MRILLQRVDSAHVDVAGERVGQIGRGLLALVGMGQDDQPEQIDPMARKLVNLRLFPSEDPANDSHFDRSLLDIAGEILVVSQFTLYANARKGRRPSFSQAAPPPHAEALCDKFVQALRQYPIRVQTGRFGADMQVGLVNQGPVTIWLDSQELLAPRQ